MNICLILLRFTKFIKYIFLRIFNNLSSKNKFAIYITKVDISPSFIKFVFRCSSVTR